MKKKTYNKPSFKVIDIELNELCVGSVCKEVTINIRRGNKLEQTHVFTDGNLINDSDNSMWDHDF